MRTPTFSRALFALVAAVLAIGALGCGNVTDENDARIAYLGVDDVVSKTLALGFAGFNAASSANIPAQSDEGDESGDIDVTGQVDQGSSDNKGMRLDVVIVDYSDGLIDDPDTDVEEEIEVRYATVDGAPLAIDLQLRDIPNGTVDGTVDGVVVMSGDLEGELTLDVSLDGDIEDDAGDTVRVPGSTSVTGTATSDYGIFEIDTEI